MEYSLSVGFDRSPGKGPGRPRRAKVSFHIPPVEAGDREVDMVTRRAEALPHQTRLPSRQRNPTARTV
jgi:hypothetical protein